MKALIAILIAAATLAPLAFAENIPPRELWPQAPASAMEGDVNGANKRVGDLTATGKSYGIVNYPQYAEAAAALSREADKQGKKDAAKWAASAAEQLDPRSAAVAFSAADRARDKGNWSRAITSSLTGFGYLARSYRSRLLARNDLFIALATAAALTIVLFALALFIRYGRAMAHDFRELVGQRLHGGAVTVVAFALLFLPVFLWMGPIWLALYWFIILFGYASKLERVFIVVLVLVLGSLPVIVDRIATEVASVDSPVMMAAIASAEQSYEPEALRRLQDLGAIIPNDDTIQILLGNLEMHEGNEKQAEVHYARAAELRDSAGAHVNLGNLHFLNNDFAAAITEYQKAQKLDARLAIAYYNNSVASGETYKFDEQGQKLEQAKAIDRAYIEKIAQNPPAQKVVMYTPPLRQAWAVAERVAHKPAARTLFGTYPFFDPAVSATNPLTLGSVLAVILAIVVWWRRRRTGFANACIKCGRTFCPRCKSARESATYCTQCIHIYLKRDGVSLDTKRSKLDEVHRYHTGMLKRDRIFSTFVPGAAQLLDGNVIGGFLSMLAFLFFVSLAVLIGRLAPAIGPVAETAKLLVRVLAALLAVIIWFALSVPVFRRRPAA